MHVTNKQAGTNIHEVASAAPTTLACMHGSTWKGAHNALLDLEELEDGRLDAFRAKYQALASAARAELSHGIQDIGTPEPEP